MKTVFLVLHARDIGEDEDIKMIGIYTTQSNADEAVLRSKNLPGFKDHPDGFSVDEYPLDEDHWEDGFVTLENK